MLLSFCLGNYIADDFGAEIRTLHLRATAFGQNINITRDAFTAAKIRIKWTFMYLLRYFMNRCQVYYQYKLFLYDGRRFRGQERSFRNEYK